MSASGTGNLFRSTVCNIKLRSAAGEETLKSALREYNLKSVP
ncbi:hypothetical protein BRYFOR_06030 [Marvinbryantia formatexigens DSM 14469]|uniref:Uncharacterized protein n=1 Tax=Marvinbryantia formatexigens DSM 14469 TaxID=478749 RepID=C6LBN5_9FIRM|nr:hypothetical protein BRYFOR_06030 [Marvinbryantia formatexigens DSM 14469]